MKEISQESKNEELGSSPNESTLSDSELQSEAEPGVESEVNHEASLVEIAPSRDIFKFWSAGLKEIGQGLFSKDFEVWRMSIFFFLSILGIGGVAGIFLDDVWDQAKEHRHHEIVQQETVDTRKKLHDQRELEKNRQLSLGNFTIELKPQSAQQGTHPKLFLATIEFVAQCDSLQTRLYLESHLLQVRGTLSGYLTSMDRGDLLSSEGKIRLRRFLLEKLNHWLSEGQIEELHITQLVVN